MGTVPIPSDAIVGKPATPTIPIPSDASFTQGQMTNDVGNQVVVPIEGESFEDTLKRATDRWKGLGKDEQDYEIQRESSRIPSKTAEALGGAATAGVVGPALLALPGHIASAAGAALLPALTKGIQAVGNWAEAHPFAAKMIYEGIKGAAWYKAIKTVAHAGSPEKE